MVKIILSIENNKPNIEIEGKVRLGELLQLLEWAKNVILSQEIVTKNIDKETKDIDKNNIDKAWRGCRW